MILIKHSSILYKIPISCQIAKAELTRHLPCFVNRYNLRDINKLLNNTISVLCILHKSKIGCIRERKKEISSSGLDNTKRVPKMCSNIILSSMLAFLCIISPESTINN